ncbi:MAG: LysM peptidoglycan-binding domain-containing protein [Desulfosarcina sp.]|nr:LysM peptidoglycan-binding domain-containing protein [Desulfosarcina sp.]MBC2743064.1 LysM peptidoglycan-binding domain-containing protein [Desulfosarcina sp.]MBC2765974.1 LysM peptidoglycan-binding domain-containing protein [Desulfosarcina sp.]
MKWKDTGGGEDENTEKGDPYYEDDGYSSLKEKGLGKTAILSGNPVRYLYWGLGIAVVAGVVLLVMLLFSNINEPADLARISALEQKIERLEQRLKKYDGVDEKVTRIWEQAKSFEKFKTRFDRSEASMSLRMDHLAMSLDALQKKTNETLEKVGKLEKAPAPAAAPASPPPVKKAAATKTHTVAAGDTLFSIGRRYNLSVEELKFINKLPEGEVIHVGQRLTVSLPGD